MTVDQVLERFESVKGAGDAAWVARCPAHDDRDPSLSIGLGTDDRVLLTCHAGCTPEEIVGAVGLTMADLFAERQNGNGKREIVATYDYVGESGELLFQVVRFHPKDFRQRKPDGDGGWEWKLGKTQRVLYRLPEVIETAKAGGKVCVVEGEKDADALAQRGVTATTSPGGAGKWKPQFSESLRGARVAVIADADEPGRKHAAELSRSLEGIAAEVRVFECAEGCKDVSDHLAAGHPLSELRPVETSGSPDPEVPPADQGPPPNTGKLLASIASTLRRFVVLTEAQRDAVALWAVHAHAIEAADTTPYLDISSAEKQSGKSRMLEVLAQLVPRAMEAANVSDAALFRALAGDGGPATLLYDEVDALWGRGATATKEEQRGLLNAGYRRGAVAWRCEGDGSKQTVTAYPVFGAKALAGIGDLPDTLADRSIPIRLRRRRPDEHVERGRYKTITAACEPLKREAARWATFYMDKLGRAEPELPEELSDRAQDGAEPLLAIADLAGGEWPVRARAALVELHGEKAEASESWGVRLLADVRAALGAQDVISTVDLIEELKADDEAPWGTWGKADTGLTPRALANLLKPYGIRRKDVRDGGWHGKGYEREQFVDAWDRYLSPEGALSGDNGDNGSVEPKTGGVLSVTDEGLSPIENSRKPHGKANVTDVTDGKHNGGAEAATEAEEAEIERLAARFGVAE